MYRPAKAFPHNDPFDRVMLAKKILLLKCWRFCRFFDDSCGNRGSCGANEGGGFAAQDLGLPESMRGECRSNELVHLYG